MKSLCVVVHDVAEARRGGCERVIAAVREVAPVPLTLLAVPRFHHAAPICDNGGIKVESIARPVTSHSSANERREKKLVPKRLFTGGGSPSPF